MPNTENIGDLPPYIIKEYSEVSLYIDVMYVNGIMFLVSASKHIGLIQSVCIQTKNRMKFLGTILLMIRIYRARGIFNIKTIGSDKACDVVKSELENDPHRITLTTCDANRHVEVIECMIRFFKERVRVV